LPGPGIAHSEETPRDDSGELNGVQLWVALPDSHRHVSPVYDHYVSLPVLVLPGGRVDLIMGDLLGRHSPARAYSPIVGAALGVNRSARLELPLDPTFEHRLLVLVGDLEIEGHSLQPDTLYYLGIARDEICLQSLEGSRVILIGGPPSHETILMWWSFVARTPEEITQAREDWKNHQRFGEVKAHQGLRLNAPTLHPAPD
jgi:quercetin 2,3-dioxygenase